MKKMNTFPNVRRYWRHLLAISSLCLLAMMLIPKLLPKSQAQSGFLLVPTEEQGDLKTGRDRTIIRHQNVEVNTEQLKDANRPRLIVPLFDQGVIVLNRERTEEVGKNGLLWFGKIADEPGSVVNLSLVNEALIGNITTQKGDSYQIRYLGRGVHSLRQIDQSKFPKEAEPIKPPKSGKRENADTCATDPPSDVDVMVAYTAAARTGAGGTDAMLATVYLAVAETNQAYLNSNITQRLRLVHVTEVAYTESGNINTDLDRLQSSTDGFMDNLHTLRNTHAADLVALLTEDGGGFCGLAYVMDTVSNGFEDYGFAVIRRSCATGYYSFGHELGHNMGARHDWYVDNTNNSPYAYNHGFVNKTPTTPATPWRTILAYNDDCAAAGVNCTRVPYFSNPNVNYPVGNDPMGVASGAQQADNRQTLNNTALTVANFRCSSPNAPDVWMKDTWNDTGDEPDPNTVGEAMWESPYIWIRNTQDTTLVHQHEHQNPEYGSTNWVYVKMHNGGTAAASGNLELYYAHASTGLSWPADWTLLTSVPVNSFAAHSTRIVEAEWNNLPGVGHYCMLARWVSAADPMTHAETTDINANVRNNNNLVWRNLNIVDLSGDTEADGIFIVRNSGRVALPSSLLIRATQSEAEHNFLREGQVIVELDTTLLRAWQRGGARGSGFKPTEKGFIITNPQGAVFENLILEAKQIGRARLIFRKLPTTSKRKFTVDAIQYDPRRVNREKPDVALTAIGGVSYEIHTDVNALH